MVRIRSEQVSLEHKSRILQLYEKPPFVRIYGMGELRLQIYGCYMFSSG